MHSNGGNVLLLPFLGGTLFLGATLFWAGSANKPKKTRFAVVPCFFGAPLFWVGYTFHRLKPTRIAWDTKKRIIMATCRFPAPTHTRGQAWPSPETAKTTRPDRSGDMPKRTKGRNTAWAVEGW